MMKLNVVLVGFILLAASVTKADFKEGDVVSNLISNVAIYSVEAATLSTEDPHLAPQVKTYTTDSGEQAAFIEGAFLYLNLKLRVGHTCGQPPGQVGLAKGPVQLNGPNFREEISIGTLVPKKSPYEGFSCAEANPVSRPGEKTGILVTVPVNVYGTRTEYLDLNSQRLVAAPQTKTTYVIYLEESRSKAQEVSVTLTQRGKLSVEISKVVQK